MDPLIGNANRGSISTGFSIDNSCYFDSSSSQKMHFTAASASSTAERRKGTFSFWIKRTKLGVSGARIIGFGETDGYDSRMFLRFLTADTMHFYPILTWTTSRMFRDTSAWYHIVIMFDTTQAEQSGGSNHADGNNAQTKCWINGVQLNDDNGLPAGNTAGRTANSVSGWGANTDNHAIGYDELDNTGYGDFYLAEFHAIQGLALAATDFGEFDEDSGVWKPKKYTGTAYGTNGFYLKFDNSADMGNDSSSEGNDFTLTNITSANQMEDSPTNNFATLNVNDQEDTGTALTVTEGNLRTTATNGSYNLIHSTMVAHSGKWYNEAKTVAVGNRTTHFVFGVAESEWTFKDSTHVWGAGDGNTRMHDLAWSWFSEPSIYNGSWTDAVLGGWAGSQTTTTANGDIYMFGLDLDNGKFWVGKNGTWFNTTQGTANPADGSYPLISNLLTRQIDDTGPSRRTLEAAKVGFGYYNDDTNSRSYQVNFGNPTFSISSGNADANGYGNFEYAPPTGFYAWCTKNLSEFG